jgi:hypothetical protein
MCITSSIFAGDTTNTGAGIATLAFIFNFGSVYSIGWTPLLALYPVEVLSFEMRAKWMAFSQLTMTISMSIETLLMGFVTAIPY